MTHSPNNLFDPQFVEPDANLSVSSASLETVPDSVPWVDAARKPEDERAYIGVAVGRRRLFASAAIAAVAVFTLTGRAFAVQIIRGEYYRNRAEGNRVRVVTIPSERGIIYDRNGTPLVENAPSLSLVVTPADLPRDRAEREATIGEIAVLARTHPGAVIDAMGGINARTLEPVAVTEGLTHEQAIQLSVAASRIPGVAVAVQTERRVLNTQTVESAGHLIGYLGRISPDEYAERRDVGYRRTDRLGKTGIEAALEEQLRGRFGRREVEVDAAGREVTIIASEKPLDGSHLELSVDSRAQEILERALKRQLDARRLRRGAAVAIDPRSGEILALVSLPGFDPDSFTRGLDATEYAALSSDPDRPLFPRAISGMYPPGSTIKPLIAAAALAEGVITPRTTVRSTGGIWYADRWWFPDWKPGGHGTVNVTNAIANSVNTFFYYVGGGFERFKGLGVERMAAYVARFGLGARLGIEIAGEAAGLVPTAEWKWKTKDEEWFIGDTYHFAIGQGDVLVTPLQMAAATSVVANGGTLYRPRLVRAVVDPVTGSRSASEPEIVQAAVVPSEVLETVRSGMRQTVTDGSAPQLMNVPVAVAGKTGTAQWNERKQNHAWFTGFAPYEDPSIAVAILVEEGGEGSSAAVPVAQEFLSWYFSRQ